MGYVVIFDPIMNMFAPSPANVITATVAFSDAENFTTVFFIY
jgi:hypothetical protein